MSATRTNGSRTAHATYEHQLAIMQELLITSDLATILGRALEQLGQVIAYEHAIIATLEGGELTVCLSRGPGLPSRSSSITVDLRHVPLLARVIQTGEPQIVADLAPILYE